MKKFFPPEFRNRLDGTIVFKKLSKEILIKIVGKFMLELKMLLKDKNTDFAGVIIKHPLTNEIWMRVNSKSKRVQMP